MIFGKKKQKYRSDEVATLGSKNYLHDKNNDGIPDYKQREEIASIVEQNKDLNKWDSDTDKEIEEWIMGLMGYEFNANTNVYVPTSPPTINEIGAKQIRNHLRSVVSKHSINTNLTISEVHETVEIASCCLTTWVKNKKLTWGLNQADLDPLVDEFDRFVFLILTRAVGDKQRDHVTKRTSYNYSGKTSNEAPGEFPG